MFRLFFTVAYLPFLIIHFLGLERSFINTVSGIDGGLVVIRHETVRRNTALIASIFKELAIEWTEERRGDKLKGSDLADGVR